jgi:hypothetical protein
MEDIRWYLEDYLQYPDEPAPRIAHRVEGRIAQLGTLLFEAVFRRPDGANEIWNHVANNLGRTSVEIICGSPEGRNIPWEFLQETKLSTPLAVTAASFVRTAPQASLSQVQMAARHSVIRILLVICRPGAGDDVPFRSIATRLVNRLGRTSNDPFVVDVLRPPVFNALRHVLQSAREAGRPYDIVHFDGHGIFAGLHATGAGVTSAPRGYVLFENPATRVNTQYVHGTLLGNVLSQAGIRLLVLNACRSGRATPARGSFADEVLATGVPNVIAMRYNVYVDTAADFIEGVYNAIAGGATVDNAVTSARRDLHAHPLRNSLVAGYL